MAQAAKPERSNSFRIEVATRLEQMAQAQWVRAICYMESSQLPEGQAPLPADQAFDANDLQATHVIAYDGEEPVGSLRIRWFHDFAEIERSAFRKEYRGSPALLKAAGEFVFRHIARKGYSYVITHANPIYARLWQRYLGFKLVAEKEPVVYFGVPYCELIKELVVPPDAVTLASSVAVVWRQEGAWDLPGRYEGS